MLTTLSSLKSRLAINPADTTHDALLTSAIQAVSARFDSFCNRSFAHTTDASHEFSIHASDLLPPCYPIQSVARFETKSSELTGWTAQPDIDYLIHRHSIISFNDPFASQLSTINYQLMSARVIYTGGYILPGTAPAPGQTPLPADLEHAALEQAALWFQNRDKLGLIRHWPSSGTYLVLAQSPLLPSVLQILTKHQRYTC